MFSCLKTLSILPAVALALVCGAPGARAGDAAAHAAHHRFPLPDAASPTLWRSFSLSWAGLHARHRLNP